MEDNKIYFILWVVVMVIALVCYIIALVKSKRGEMVFTANGWDMALLFACPVLLLAGGLMQENPSLDTTRIVLWTLGGLCFAGTAIFSIVYNKGSLWKILCSIMAKVCVIWLTMFILMLLLVILLVSLILFFVRDRNDDDGDYILLKYDHFLRAYVGYRV